MNNLANSDFRKPCKSRRI